MADINLKTGVKLQNEAEVRKRLGGLLKDLRKNPYYKDITFCISDGYRDFKEQIKTMVTARVKILEKTSKELRAEYAKLTMREVKDPNHSMGKNEPHKESMTRLYGLDDTLKNILYLYDISLAKDTSSSNITAVQTKIYNDMVKAYPRALVHGTTFDVRQVDVLSRAFKHANMNAFDVSINDLHGQLDKQHSLLKQSLITKKIDPVLPALQYLGIDIGKNSITPMVINDVQKKLATSYEEMKKKIITDIKKLGGSYKLNINDHGSGSNYHLHITLL